MRKLKHFKSKEAYRKWLAYGHIRTKTGKTAKSKKMTVFAKTPGYVAYLQSQSSDKTRNILTMENNNRGQMMIINLLLFVMVIAVMVALIPALNMILNNSQQSDGLNCNGYSVNGNPNATLSYNASLATNTLACVAIRLYLPYIVLVILVGGVTKLLMGRVAGGETAAFQ